MANNYYQKRKERIQKKKPKKGTKIFVKKKKIKDEKGLENDIKILLQKKKKKLVSIIRNVRTSFLTIEEIII